MIFNRKVKVVYERKSLTKGQAGSLSRLNDMDLIETKEALKTLIDNYIRDIMDSYMFEGKMDIKEVVWKMSRIIPAVEKADKHKTKTKTKEQEK